MNKIKLEKGTCYKINLPSENDITESLNNFIELSSFNKCSPIINAFSIDLEEYNNFKLKDYTNKYDLDKSILYFYESMKDLPFQKLSIKQKIILSIVKNLKNDCLLISFESLSEKTKIYLIFLSYFLTNYQGGKTFLFLDFSTTDITYNKVEIVEIKPNWKEILVN